MLRIRRIPLPTALFVAGMTLVTGSPGEAGKKPAAVLLLPDLVTPERSLRDHAISVENGRTLLRLTSTLLNVGEGPLEVRGRAKRARMAAYQELYQQGSTRTRTRKIGSFEWHPDHGHWHLLQVAEYRLLDDQGQVLAKSGKISFCLADDWPWQPDLPGAPAGRVYNECSEVPTARGFVSGISVGWGDTYLKDIYGQWIDVTGIPPGQYTLQCVVNPAGLLIEKSLDNNSASVPVTLP